MSHEARINDALKALGEEFRLGMIGAEEYRARRRKLLESWGERDATTAPGAMRTTQPGLLATQPPRPARPSAAPAPAPAEAHKLPWIVGVAVGLVLVAAAGWFAMDPRKDRGAAPATPGSARTASPEVRAIAQAADEFLARNAWEAEAIAGFLGQWRALSPAHRAEAQDEPSVQRLRYRLDENIKAESQLAGADASPQQRAQLEMLQSFASELAP